MGPCWELVPSTLSATARPGASQRLPDVTASPGSILSQGSRPGSFLLDPPPETRGSPACAPRAQTPVLSPLAACPPGASAETPAPRAPVPGRVTVPGSGLPVASRQSPGGCPALGSARGAAGGGGGSWRTCPTAGALPGAGLQFCHRHPCAGSPGARRGPRGVSKVPIGAHGDTGVTRVAGHRGWRRDVEPAQPFPDTTRPVPWRGVGTPMTFPLASCPSSSPQLLGGSTRSWGGTGGFPLPFSPAVLGTTS